MIDKNLLFLIVEAKIKYLERALQNFEAFQKTIFLRKIILEKFNEAGCSFLLYQPTKNMTIELEKKQWNSPRLQKVLISYYSLSFNVGNFAGVSNSIVNVTRPAITIPTYTLCVAAKKPSLKYRLTSDTELWD